MMISLLKPIQSLIEFVHDDTVKVMLPLYTLLNMPVTVKPTAPKGEPRGF